MKINLKLKHFQAIFTLKFGFSQPLWPHLAGILNAGLVCLDILPVVAVRAIGQGGPGYWEEVDQTGGRRRRAVGHTTGGREGQGKDRNVEIRPGLWFGSTLPRTDELVPPEHNPSKIKSLRIHISTS